MNKQMLASRLRQQEADVVFVGYNAMEGAVHVAAHWESTMNEHELPLHAAVLGLQWNEEDGGGEVTVFWYDFRAPETHEETF